MTPPKMGDPRKAQAAQAELERVMRRIVSALHPILGTKYSVAIVLAFEDEAKEGLYMTSAATADVDAAVYFELGIASVKRGVTMHFNARRAALEPHPHVPADINRPAADHGVENRLTEPVPEEVSRLLETYVAGEWVRAIRGIIDATHGREVAEGRIGCVLDPQVRGVAALVRVRFTATPSAGATVIETSAGNLEPVDRPPNHGGKGGAS